MSKIKELYFDYIYNPVYDLSTAQLVCYQRMQSECLTKLNFRDSEKVLSIGVGTGSEIIKILGMNNKIDIYAIDTSGKALAKAERKTAKLHYPLKTFRMDAQKIDFKDEFFDKVICIHVMGFITDDVKATDELLRVLKTRGQFTATFPSGAGGPGLAAEIKNSINNDIKEGKYGKALKQIMASLLAGIVYLPGMFWVRPKRGFYSYTSLKEMLDNKSLTHYTIEEDRDYQDFIVYGIK